MKSLRRRGAEQLEGESLTTIAIVALTELGADGVNLLNCSGAEPWQTVFPNFHFHLHLIPRYRHMGKDRLKLPFEPGMPADAEAMTECARVLGAALQAS